MKSDIDTLMQSANIDALLITGPGQHNPAMVYLTGTAYLTSAELIKRRGEPPVLFYNSMERDEAISTGLGTRNLDDYRIIELINQYDGDIIKATAERYRLMFRELGITNDRVAVYGQRDAGEAFAVLSVLQDMMPEVTLVGEFGDSILLKAMATKDEDEVERIRCMGQDRKSVV